MTLDNEGQESWSSSTRRIAEAAIAATSCGRSLRSAAPRERPISVVCRPSWAADARTYPCRRPSSSIVSKGRDVWERARLKLPPGCVGRQAKNRRFRERVTGDEGDGGVRLKA